MVSQVVACASNFMINATAYLNINVANSSFVPKFFLCFSVSQSASQFQIDFSGRQQRQLIDLMSPPFFLWAYDCVIRLSHIDHATGWLNTTYSCTHTHEDKERLPHKSLKRAVGETEFRGANAIVRHAKFRLRFLWELWQDLFCRERCEDFYYKSSWLYIY